MEAPTNYDAAALTAAVKEAMAQSGVLADLTERLHALTNPQPTPSASFTDEEQSAMAQAVADLRKRKAQEVKEAEEDAKLKAFTKECRDALISSGQISPETDEERKLWRKRHGFEYRNHNDLRRY